MTREEKVQLNRDRQKAVRDAWLREKDLVSRGKGTVDWTKDQQRELLEKGHVEGYEGQHMKSCSEYPEYAKDVDNIQLLSHQDHIDAHNYSNLSEKKGYHSPTNGYYDVKSKTMQSFGDGPPRAPQEFKISNAYYKEFANEQDIDCQHIGKENYSKLQNNMSKAHMIEKG